MYDYDSVSWGCGDGLQFFVNQAPNAETTDPFYETTGTLRLTKIGNGAIKNFLADFGSNVHYEFTVGYPLGYNAPKTAPTEPVPTGLFAFDPLHTMMNVYPNPGTNMVRVDLEMDQEADGEVSMTDISGRMVKQLRVSGASKYQLSIPVAELGRGIYFVNFMVKGSKYSRKVVLQ